MRSQFQRVMGWGRRSSKKLKIYFCSWSNEIIWYPLEGSIRTKTKHSKRGNPCRQTRTLAEVNFFEAVIFSKGRVSGWRKLRNGEDGSASYC